MLLQNGADDEIRTRDLNLGPDSYRDALLPIIIGKLHPLVFLPFFKERCKYSVI